MHVARAPASSICIRSAPSATRARATYRPFWKGHFLFSTASKEGCFTELAVQMSRVQRNAKVGFANRSHCFGRSDLLVERQPGILAAAVPSDPTQLQASAAAHHRPLRRSSPWPSRSARCSDGAPWLRRLAGESTATSAAWPCSCRPGWTRRRCVCRGTRPEFERELEPIPTGKQGVPPPDRHQPPPCPRQDGLTLGAYRDTPPRSGRTPALPPGCCASNSASPNLAGRREAAGPRRLPAFPSR